MQKSKINPWIRLSSDAERSRTVKNQSYNTNFKIIISGVLLCIVHFAVYLTACAQNQNTEELELTIDVTAATTPLPKIFRPNLDLSGRGYHRDPTWPQELAAKEVLEQWKNEIKFNGFYRVQFNLWEISQLSRNYFLQKKLLDSYENIIRTITESGGTVILDIFGMPAGMGKILDRKSAPLDLKAFKSLVKDTIRYFSCEKKYNIWYEVWSAPDLDEFFLGRKQEYLYLYRIIAEAVKELKRETKINIPVGGPGVSWWFQNFDGNSTLKPEESLIYEFIKFCHRYRLPLDFISWHSYSTSPAVEREETIYSRPAVGLIRDWLDYFRFSRNTPLIISEWNYDRSANVLPERKEKSYIAASYIPARIKNMQEAGVDNQIYYSLEDFQANKEGVVRNVGVFYFDPEHTDYRGGPKAIYNVFRMMANLGNELFTLSLKDNFIGAVVTKTQDNLVFLLYNYIDPEMAINYLSRNIAVLSGSERKTILNLIKSDRLAKILSHQLEIKAIYTTNRVRNLLKKSLELNDKALKYGSNARSLKIIVKNLKDFYLYSRYAVDSDCNINCKFIPQEEKEIDATKAYEETISLKPYSVYLVVLKKKPKEAEPAVAPAGAVPSEQKPEPPKAETPLQTKVSPEPKVETPQSVVTPAREINNKNGTEQKN